MQKYFAFGSNLSHRQMKQRCPDSSPLTACKVRNYTTGFSGYAERWGGGGACLIPAEGQCVYGGIYNVSKEDLEKLDYYEGVPKIYQRTKIEVETACGEKVEAITYAKNDLDHGPPSDKYLRVILEGHLNFNLSTRSISRALIHQNHVCNRFFVYASLKKGHSNHDRFLSDLSFVNARCENGELLRISNSLLAMSEKRESNMDGELYDLSSKTDLWPRLDEFEVYSRENPEGSLYERALILARPVNGERHLAWSYLVGEETCGKRLGSPFSHFL